MTRPPRRVRKTTSDKERLDWLAKNDAAYRSWGPGGQWHVRTSIQAFQGQDTFDARTLRAAIDAAMKAGRKR